MRQFILAATCVAMMAGLSAIGIPAAQALTTQVYTGTIVHVSTENVKVESSDKAETVSFLLVPKFKQVFSSDGKTTVQMSALKPGTPVKVYFDQTALGARHADKIVILDNGAQIKS
jgi:hypothetical protein